MIVEVCGGNNWFAGPNVNISIVRPAVRNYHPDTLTAPDNLFTRRDS